MSKRQAHTLMALAASIIVTQILCTALLLRSLERSRTAAEWQRIDALNSPSRDSAAIATEVSGAAVQADGSPVTVEVSDGAQAVPTFQPPPSGFYDLSSAEDALTAGREAVMRERADEATLRAEMNRALRNSSTTHAASAETNR